MSLKNYFDEICVEKLRSVKFLDYSYNTCVNNIYQEFLYKFLSAVDSSAQIRTLKVKSNTKPWFDIDVYYAI